MSLLQQTAWCSRVVQAAARVDESELSWLAIVVSWLFMGGSRTSSGLVEEWTHACVGHGGRRQRWGTQGKGEAARQEGKEGQERREEEENQRGTRGPISRPCPQEKAAAHIRWFWWGTAEATGGTAWERGAAHLGHSLASLRVSAWRLTGGL